jgi:hypothetical protein
VTVVTRPAHLWIPPQRRGSYGDEVAGIAKSLNRPLEGWQDIAVDAINSYGAGGRWHTLESGVIVPRQNGKSLGIALPTVIADCLLWPEPDRVVWSTHRVNTYQETFQLVKLLIDEHSWLSSRVAKLIDNHQESIIHWTNGSNLTFVVRSPGQGRGLGGRTVVVDEALYFPSADAGALLPIMGRRDNPRIIYLSSACKLVSAQLASLVARGRAMNDEFLSWAEWCAPGSLTEPGCRDAKCRHRLDTPGCSLDNPEYHAAANPAIGAGKMRPSIIAAFRRALSANPTEFAREHYGWHEDAEGASTGTITVILWDSRKDPHSAIAGERVISVDVAPDGASAAIGGAGYREDGDVHLALVDHRAGVSWAVPRALALMERDDVAALVLDPGSPAAELLPDLQAAGLRVRDDTNGGEIVLMTTRDAGAAAGILRTRLAPADPDDKASPRAWHRGEKGARDAVEGSKRRRIGNGGWGFDRIASESDITPIVAISGALWGLVSGAVCEVSVHGGDELQDGEGQPEGYLACGADQDSAHLGIFNLPERGPDSADDEKYYSGEDGPWDVAGWVG